MRQPDTKTKRKTKKIPYARKPSVTQSQPVTINSRQHIISQFTAPHWCTKLHAVGPRSSVKKKALHAHLEEVVGRVDHTLRLVAKGCEVC